MSKELKKKELLFSWIDKLDKKLSPSMKTKDSFSGEGIELNDKSVISNKTIDNIK